MKRIFFGVVLFIYLVVSITVTVFLFNYDVNKVTKLGDTYFINMSENVGNYAKNDLLVISKNDNAKLKVSDEIIYFDVTEETTDVAIGSITKMTTLINNETLIYLENARSVKGKNVLGKTDDVKKVSNVGGILSVLESKWGYLCIIVLPISLLFIYEVYTISREFRKRNKPTNEKS